jgi:hypothetical protein
LPSQLVWLESYSDGMTKGQVVVADERDLSVGMAQCPMGGPEKECYLVDPASGHMLVSKIKPCKCQHPLERKHLPRMFPLIITKVAGSKRIRCPGSHGAY